ncbi:MAG: DNA gyrase subunit A [Candidatus Cloacimonetes bacterium 4572_55]|nr:MAG: DNA gyrase subunit A [Candidatus Cloacimonetes bacterium 4572_55]
MPQETIIPRNIEDEMKSSYIDYSMSVIVSRALPDVRDGLKPVHRRVLYGMFEQNLYHNRRYVKSARAVGHVMANYHPHGDTAIYHTIVRMVQDFSLRYPLVDGQGNFGSVDGDDPAAMRYTEIRLERIAEEVLRNLDKDTVDFIDNFDGSNKEPVVLPTAIPQLLMNGSSGIAVGMATNIPPHNLREVVRACLEMIENPDVTIQEIIQHLHGPDFPTGGIIYGRMGIQQAYATGHGMIRLRGVARIEDMPNNRNRIIITEIPYQVNKSSLIERIVALARHKKVEGISDLRDESDRDGMRIVIELRRDAQPSVVLNQLYKHSQLQVTFGANMLALVNNRPRVLNIKEIIHYFLEYRHEVVSRRTRFKLRKAEARAHLLEGLRKAVDHIDEIVSIIRDATNPDAAREKLMNTFELTEIQANAILDLQLKRMTGLERQKLDREQAEILKQIDQLRLILSDRDHVMEIVKKELIEVGEKYGDERRTEIVDDKSGSEITIEELIPEEDMVITISHSGYIKRLPLTTYRSQRRGGRGVTGMETKEQDFVEHLFISSTHWYILFFTDHGQCYWRKVYQIPQGGRLAKGKAIINLLRVEQSEKVRAYLPVSEFDDNHFILFVTKKGLVKKSPLKAFSKPRRGGIIGLNIHENDELIDVRMTDGDQDIIISTAEGKAIRFHEMEARPMGRTASGVRGVRLSPSDYVVGIVTTQNISSLLTVTRRGFGKRSSIDEYPRIHRGGKGVIDIKTAERNGNVVAIKGITNSDELMIITKNGVVIRIAAQSIREIGRNSMGVRLINLDDNDEVIDIARIIVPTSIENGGNESDPTPSE